MCENIYFVHEINDIDDTYKDVVLLLEKFNNKITNEYIGETLKIRNQTIIENKIQEGNYVIKEIDESTKEIILTKANAKVEVKK